MAKTVIILGGAYGGLHVAHYLLKNNSDVKVVLVSKSSHFYWNIASVRAIVPNTLKDEQLFVSLEQALNRYPKDRVEIIVGSAETVDVDANTVTVAADGGLKTLAYDQLVLATGSRCNLPDDAASAGAFVPWKADGTYEEATALLRSIHDKVKAAAHIVVAGGGSTGVEAAAELAYEYGGKSVDQGGKEIVLLSGSADLIAGDAIADSAAKELKKLHVDVHTNAKVQASKVLPDGRVELTVAGATEPLITDLYLPSYGLTPNTDYLPARFLSERKNVVIDDCYRVSGVQAQNVWALGDVVSKPKPSYFITQKQAAGVGKNVHLAIKGQAPLPVKVPGIDVLVVATGRGRGVGRMNSIQMPSFAVWLAKGRTLGIQKVPAYLDGSVA